MLRRGHRVCCCQQTIDNAEFLVHQINKRCGAIGRTRRVRHHWHALSILIKIHAFNEHRGVFARSGDYHLFGARLNVTLNA